MAAPTAETVEVTVWVLVDENGDYVASDAIGHATERYDEQIGADRDVTELRRVKVTLTVPVPKPAELVGAVAAVPVAGELTAA